MPESNPQPTVGKPLISPYIVVPSVWNSSVGLQQLFRTEKNEKS